MKEKVACDGRVLKWEPDLYWEDPVWLDENEDPPEPSDRAEPGFHAPRPESRGVVNLNTISELMITGYTCDWCNQYQKSIMEAVTDNMFKPSPLMEFFKTNR